MTAEMYLPTFYVQQKFAMTTNRYALYAANADGSFGQLMGVAQQKRMAFKEEVTFYADESRSRPVFSFKARKRVDLGSGYDITDEAGRQIGFFRKDFGASLLRSTFHVEGPGYAGTGQERSCGASWTSRSCRSTSTTSTAPAPRCSPSSGRAASATSTPSTCPTSGSTSGSPPRSRSPWMR
jgi:hypothetical protein